MKLELPREASAALLREILRRRRRREQLPDMFCMHTAAQADNLSTVLPVYLPDELLCRHPSV